MPDRDWQALPCREFCNRHGCQPGGCRNSLAWDDPRRWLGRGQESVPGKPFGWAHCMEREAIRAHLLGRGMPDGVELFFRVSRMQGRLHRDYHRRKPPIGVRRVVRAKARPDFTVEELERIAERFEGSNDQLGQEIARKARELIS
jgi:hypothetical protein